VRRKLWSIQFGTLLRFTPAGMIYLFVSLWGCLAVYSVTRHLTPSYWFAARQMVWVAIGVVALLLSSARDTQFYRGITFWWAAVAYLLLLAVLPFGIRINGMRGWFAWRGVFFQPSEFSKPVFVLCLARVMERSAAHRSEWFRGYFPCLLCVIVWALPVTAQPDFGVLLVYGLAFGAMYWSLGGPPLHLFATALAAIPAVLAVCWRYPYVQRRFVAFLNPQKYANSSGWHLIQFQRTLASGGLFGRPWSSGRWAQGYLPLGYSDSIFASIAEATGFFGVLPIVVLTVALVAYGCYVSHRSHSLFRAGATVGLVAMISGQALIHLSVNLGLMPPTGITLPMISYGGSSLVSSLLALGVIEGLNQEVS